VAWNNASSAWGLSLGWFSILSGVSVFLHLFTVPFSRTMARPIIRVGVLSPNFHDGLMPVHPNANLQRLAVHSRSFVTLL